MTNGGAVPDEPEPIDAEFEPTGENEPRRNRKFAPAPMRSRSIGLSELLIFSGGASVLGAVMAIVVTNANSGASTGTLAREIDALNRAQSELSARADQTSSDVVAMRSRLDSQADKLLRQDADELSMRSEISAVASQVSALSGAGPGSGSSPGALAANTPLGVLLSRINRLENVIADDASAPQTTRQLQRAFADISARVDQLNEANTTLTEALNKRQAALSALETGLESLSTDMDSIRGRVVADQRIGEGLGIVRPSASLSALGRPPEFAAEESKTIRALSSLETAAQRGGPFLPQQQVLASLLPQDAAVADLQELARKGAPTSEQLRRDFNVSARNAERIAAERTDDGWNWLRSNSPGEAGSRGIDSATIDLIADARRALEVGDTRGAVEYVDGIGGAAAKAFRAWRGEALRRAELDQRLHRLNQRLVGARAEVGGGKDS
jgi:hypothetical protein